MIKQLHFFFLLISLFGQPLWGDATLASDPVSTTDIPLDQELLDFPVVEDQPADQSSEGLQDVFDQPTFDVFTPRTSKK